MAVVGGVVVSDAIPQVSRGSIVRAVRFGAERGWEELSRPRTRITRSWLRSRLRRGLFAVGPPGYGGEMARKVWTAAEMESLTRREQQAIFDESVVIDLDSVPSEFLDQVQADAERLIEARESQPTD